MSVRYEKKKILIIGIICFLFLLPLIIFKVIDLSKTNEVEKKVFSIPTSEVKTLKEKVVGASEIKTSNGIYYYNGANVNNNLLFAGKCWQIVRTTDNDGVKLIYNGEPVNGTCATTTNYIDAGKVAYNNDANKITSVGYMYGDYEYGKINFLTDEAGVSFGGMWGASDTGGTSYYYGTGANWNSTAGYYELVNETKYSGSDYTMGLTHKYTCGSTSAGATCEVVYIAVGGSSSASYVSLPPGRNYSALDYFKIIDGFENAGVQSQGNISWAFSNSFSYTGVGGTFKLDYGTGNYTTYDMSSWTSGSTAFNDYHFTCFSTSTTPTTVSEKEGFPNISVSMQDLMASFSGGELASKFYDITLPKVNTSCSEMYYIFYSGNAGLYYLKLDNTMTASEVNSILSAINSGTYLDGNLLSSNSKNSNVKSVVDDWYNTYLGNSTYKQYIIDDVYVNDRNLASGGGWINKTDLTKNITFSTYNGSTSGFSTEDKFTLSSGSINSTNKALTSPVGLLSYDEAVLAGVTSSSSSYLGSNAFWLMSPHSYAEEASTTSASYDMVSYVYSINNGLTNSAVNSTNYVRPVISVSADIPVAGTGTEEDPYRLVYKVEYSISGDGPSVTLPEVAYYEEGEIVTVDTTFSSGYQVDGYSFNGWNKSGTFTMTTEDVNITGSWTKMSYFSPQIEVYAPISSNNSLDRSVRFVVTVTNTADFPIKDVVVKVSPYIYCDYVYGITCENIDGESIKIVELGANTSYSTSVYGDFYDVIAGAIVPGTVTATATIVSATADAALLAPGTYTDTDVASSKAGVKLCNVLTNTGNGTVNHYRITGSDNSSYYLVVSDNECTTFSLNTGVEYTLYQLEKQEFVLNSVTGLITSNGAKFTLEPKEYEVTFNNTYTPKGYFHTWDRVENSVQIYD